MQYRKIPAGSTSRILQVEVYDSSSATGAKLAGLVYNSSGLTCWYNRAGASGAATSVSLQTATKGTWSSGGFVAVDGTNMPGIYELHVPDAALAAGASSVAIVLRGAANMVDVCILIELDASVVQTGDSYARLGAPAGASVSADVASVKTDTGTTIPGRLPSALTGAGNIKADVEEWKAATAPAMTGDAYAQLGTDLTTILAALAGLSASGGFVGGGS